MKIDIHAGKRVLYKDGGNWNIGKIAPASAKVNSYGLWLAIIPKEYFDKPDEEIQYAEVNNVFLEAVELDPYIKEYKDYFMTKEEYCDWVEQEDFVKAAELAYVSDGEFVYYPVSRYTRNWIEKQPFDYVVRGN